MMVGPRGGAAGRARQRRMTSAVALRSRACASSTRAAPTSSPASTSTCVPARSSAWSASRATARPSCSRRSRACGRRRRATSPSPGESILPLGVLGTPRAAAWPAFPKIASPKGWRPARRSPRTSSRPGSTIRAIVRHGLLDLKAIRANARTLIERFSIRVGGPAAAVATLSGGNMQKVVVARELAEQPKVLLVSQPTRGVDLGATQFIWRTITEARDAGAAVLLSSADLSELLALSRPAGRVLSRPHRRGLPSTPTTLTPGNARHLHARPVRRRPPEEMQAALA